MIHSWRGNDINNYERGALPRLLTAGPEAVYRMNPDWIRSQAIQMLHAGGEVVERFGTVRLLSPGNHLLAVRELKKTCIVLFLSCSACNRASNPDIPIA